MNHNGFAHTRHSRIADNLARSLALTALFLLAASAPAPAEAGPPRSAGILDLRSYDFDRMKRTARRKWEFYWERLLEPSPCVKAYRRGRVFFDVPESGTTARRPAAVFSGDGFATFRLLVLTGGGRNPHVEDTGYGHQLQSLP